MSRAHVLLVDDEPVVGELIRQALHRCGCKVTVAHDGQEALQVLARERISLCLTDLHLPSMSGVALARHVRRYYPDIPVVIMTETDSVTTLRELLDSGVSDVVTKSICAVDLPLVIERNLHRHRLWMDEQKRHLRQLNEAYSDMLEALLTALETREREIEGHCERVTTYTMLLAEAVGVPHHQHPHIERGALLHDVGKIGIPDHILFKEGPLTAAEWEIMRQHPVIGYRMCMRVRSLQRAAEEIVLCHHEHWDGSGYPQGLRGEDIPIGARIFAIADTLDAMTSDRPYRTALSLEQAAAEIERCAGTQFDPQIVKAFLSIPASVWETLIEQLRTSKRLSPPADSPSVQNKAA
jgi:response regulator RpfG family c-di-GMP phosphodiesterase